MLQSLKLILIFFWRENSTLEKLLNCQYQEFLGGKKTRNKSAKYPRLIFLIFFVKLGKNRRKVNNF